MKLVKARNTRKQGEGGKSMGESRKPGQAVVKKKLIACHIRELVFSSEKKEVRGEGPPQTPYVV